MIKRILIRLFIGIVVINVVVISFYHSIDTTPIGFRFSLFKNTPVWELAKAVKDEDTAEIRELIQEKHFDVNYQLRPHWGETLLHIAVGNDKLLSVKELLENGAKQVADNSGNYPINDIVNMLDDQTHRSVILELLLKHGADPNAQIVTHTGNVNIDSTGRVPLSNAVQNLECTKLLVKYGGNVYFQTKSRNYRDSCSTYFIWNEVFNFYAKSGSDENIFVAKYLVIDRKLPIPNPLYYNGHKTDYDIYPVTVTNILKNATFTDPAKAKAKEDILAYLHKVGFPEHGAINNNSPKR